MDTFGLKIIASDGVFYAGRCQKLTIPAPDGEKGILAHHENMVIAVTVGIARMNVDGTEWKEIAVGTGFAEIVYFLMEEMCMEGQRSAMYISFVVQTQAGVSLPGIPFL